MISILEFRFVPSVSFEREMNGSWWIEIPLPLYLLAILRRGRNWAFDLTGDWATIPRLDWPQTERKLSHLPLLPPYTKTNRRSNCLSYYSDSVSRFVDFPNNPKLFFFDNFFSEPHKRFCCPYNPIIYFNIHSFLFFLCLSVILKLSSFFFQCTSSWLVFLRSETCFIDTNANDC